MLELVACRDALKGRYRGCLSRHAISEAQWRVLDTLNRRGPQDATRLARHAVLLPSSLTHILAGLEARDLVRARRDPDDARRIQLRLSRGGRELLDEIGDEVAMIDSAVTDCLGAADTALLCAALRRMRMKLQDDPDAPVPRLISGP
ncbi:MarR family winged helix-turn-helix transcriptional regulator [Thetidibacter halocola]|uniref:MarR family transcriptional regulator n=1 Tax=Thetidibacter halocola TaxID=2827239 RepID=A0A8J7WEK3_9RHOB|nr:MarR family transcriptional regulator [Thetidibacter halocola]MBS0126190.1 MarR family transcriptional regulator [Thetidibacter halocola]